MEITPEIQQWLEWMILTSQPLRKLSEDKMPVGIASGTLLDFRGKRFLLTVSHAVNMENTDWVMELGYDENEGTEVYKLNHFSYIGELNIKSGKMEHIDYAYAEIATDVHPVFQTLTPRGPASEKMPRHIFTEEDIVEPSVNSVYAFSGQVFPERHGESAFVTQPTVYPGLKFLRSEGSFHIFKLPVEHPGHDSFQGCSGAPIVDLKGKIVALVCKGFEEDNTIYGVSLSRYKFSLEFHCSEINPN